MYRKLIYLTSFVLLLGLTVGDSRADLIVAEELLVDLRADELPYGEDVTTWINHGTLGNFTAQGAPVVEDVAGEKAITFDGASWFDGPSSVAGIEGTGTRSIEVWAYNPTVVEDEETMLSWAHRGGPDGTNMAFNYCTHGTWGSVGHWGGAADMGWWGSNSPAPAANTWWHLAYTFNGTGVRIYVNGVQESVTDPISLNTHGGTPIRVAAQADGTGAGVEGAMNFTGSIASVRIHDGVLSPADIQNNFKLGRVKASNPDPADDALLGVLGTSLSWTVGGTAASHNVYFGTDYAEVEAGTGDTFRGNQTSPYFLAGYGYTPNDPVPTGFVPGTTYYWRVDEVEADGVTKHTGDVWSFMVPDTTAYSPTPADEGQFIDPNADLSWESGFGAIDQTIYFGDDYDTVSTATTGGTGLGGGTTYDPGPLEIETVYYWRVDTFSAYGLITGDVWSFRTVPVIPITDPNLVGWWKFDEGQGSLALDWSGQGNHGTIQGGGQWVAGYDGDALRLDGIDDYVSLPIGPVIESLTSSTFTTWVDFSNAGGAWQRIFDFGNNTTTYMFLTPRLGTTEQMRFGITIEGGGAAEQLLTAPNTLPSGWHHVAVTINASTNTGTLYLDGLAVASNNATTLTPSDLGSTNNNWLGRSQYAADGYLMGVLDDFRIYDYAMSQDEIKDTMRGDPLLVWDPSPANGSTPDLDEAMPLSWSPGDKASQHDVYFGTDEDAVEFADISDTTGIYRIRQSGTNYTPGEGVEWGGGPYYWRIDEYNTDGTISKGRVWSFTVADFINIDNIEGYDAVNQIWYNWVDGLGFVKPDNTSHPGNGSGSEVGDPDTASFTEETITHSGGKSMPFKYNNNNPFKLNYSEAKLTLSDARDWTKHGVKALSLWFYGYPASVGSFTDNFDGTYSMTGSGADIWNVGGVEADEFHFAYKTLTGAGTIIARVDSVSDTHDWAKAGVMIRETLDPNSANAFACITPANGVSAQGRPSTGDVSVYTNQVGITAPHWVKLERDMAGNFTVTHSVDGLAWEPVENAPVLNIPMNSNVYVGLAVTAHDPALTCEAVFFDVTITGAVSGQWASQDIGIQSNDAEPMYVAISNNTGAPVVVYHDNPNAAQIDDWTEWNIDLRDFVGINLADVNSIAIGLGNRNNPQAGGSGKMYFDDFALYRPRYVPGKGTPLAADLNNDGVVDYRDLDIMAGDWLTTDYFTAATVPSGSPVGWWKFDDNTNDSAGTNHGTLNGSPGYVAGVDGQAISLDGIDDYVSLPIGSVIESLTNSTFATWVDFSNAGGAWQRIFDFGNDTTAYMFLTPRLGTAGQMRFGITIEGGGASEQLVTALSTLPSGWHHVAVTINADTDTSTLYLDGLAVASNTSATLTPSDLGNTSNNWLGRSQYSADAYLNGVLDDFRIYNHVLTDAEIAGLVDDTPGDGQLYVQVPSPANIYDDEPQGSRSVNLKDYAVLADQWLEEQLWPEL